MLNNNNNNNNIILSDKQYSINYRINYIKNIINECDFEPMVNLDYNDDNDCIYNDINKNNIDYKDLINSLGSNLQYIKSGSTGHTFKGSYIINEEEYHFAIKIVVY